MHRHTQKPSGFRLPVPGCTRCMSSRGCHGQAELARAQRSSPGRTGGQRTDSDGLNAFVTGKLRLLQGSHKSESERRGESTN